MKLPGPDLQSNRARNGSGHKNLLCRRSRAVSRLKENCKPER